MSSAPPHPKGSGTYQWDIPIPPTTANVTSWIFVAEAEKWQGDGKLVPWDVFRFAKNGGQGEIFSNGQYWYVVRGTHSSSMVPFYTYGPIYIFRSQPMSDNTVGACPVGVECLANIDKELHGGTTGAPVHPFRKMTSLPNEGDQPFLPQSGGWMQRAENAIPKAVQLAFIGPNGTFRSQKTPNGWYVFFAEGKWWGYIAGPNEAWFCYMHGGSAPTMMNTGYPTGYAAPLGQDVTTPPCCPTNAIYWLAAAVGAIAVAQGVRAYQHSKGRR